MRIKSILFCFVVLGMATLIKMIPWNQLITGFEGYPYRKLVISSAEMFLLFFPAIYLVSRYRLWSAAGLRDHQPANYWMMLIPVLYPGIIQLTQYETSCGLWSFGFLVFCCYRFFAALFEEFVFRGLIQGYLSRAYPERYHRVNLISAILFGLIHLYNLRHSYFPSVLSQVVFAFYMGLLFSAIFRRVRNIWIMGVSHALVNIVMSGYCRSQQPETTEASFTLSDCLEAILSAAVLMSPVLLFYYLLMLPYSKRDPNAKN